MERLLTTAESAEALGGLSVRTLEGWRRRRTGPRFVRLGHGPGARVRYRPSDLEDWLEEVNRVKLTAAQAEPGSPRRSAGAGGGR